MSLLGLDAKVYRNTGTYGSPTWTEWDWIKETTLSLSKSEADATTRANGGWRAIVGALKDGSIEITGPHDTADAQYLAAYRAFYLDTVFDLAIVDGPIATVGTRGLRASFMVTALDRGDPLEDVKTTSMTLKITKADDAPVEWHTAS
jgi:predicted secreted protein